MRIKEKLISVLLVVTMLMSMLVGIIPANATTATLANNETGTVDTTGCTPISTVDEFFAMTSGNKYYLVNDLDLRGKENFLCGWVVTEDPAGLEKHKVFSNFVLEGNNKTLTIDRPIFNILQNVEIRNLTIDGTLTYENNNDRSTNPPYGSAKLPYYQSPLSSGTQNGAIAGTAPGKVTLKYVTSNVDIVATQTYQYKYVSGVIYQTGAGSVFDHVSYNGNITTFNAGQKDTATDETKFEAISGIVGCVAGETTFNSCSTSGSIVVSKNVKHAASTNPNFASISGGVGGLVGKANAKVTFNNCVNNMTIESNTPVAEISVGGLIGRVNSGTMTATGCRNTGAITCAGGNVGGIVGASYALVNITNCSNSGAISNATNNIVSCLGGIAGRVSNDTANPPAVTLGTFTFDGCTNTGNITSYRPSGSTDLHKSGSGTGGILGLAWGYTLSVTSLSLDIKNCTNSGNITTHSSLASTAGYEQRGGIVGYIALIKNVSVTGCTNNGNITALCDATVWNMANGGIIGTYRVFGEYTNGNGIPASYPSSLTVKNCINNGDISGLRCAGILANSNEAGGNSTFTFEKCVNNGDINAKENGGGIIALLERGSGSNGPTLTLTECVNTGKIDGVISAGGMVGNTAFHTTTLTKCVNSGNVSSPADAAGMIAKRIYGTAAITLSQCANAGVLSGWTTAGMVANTSSAVNATSCVNIGKISDIGGEGGAIVDATNGNTFTANSCIYLIGSIDAAYSNGAAVKDQAAITEAMNSANMPAYDMADIKANYAFAQSIKDPAKLYGNKLSAFNTAKAEAKACIDAPLSTTQKTVNEKNVALYNALWDYTDTATYQVTIPETVASNTTTTIALNATNLTELSRIKLVLDSSFALTNEHGDTIKFNLLVDGKEINEKTVVFESVGKDISSDADIKTVLEDTTGKTPGTYRGNISFTLVYNNGKYDINPGDEEEGDDEFVTEVPEITKEVFDDSTTSLSAIVPEVDDNSYFYVKNIDIGQGSLMHIAKCSGIDAYKAYLYELQEAGFTYYTENAIGDNLYTTFATKTQILNVMYMKAFGELRVIVDKRRQGTYNQTISTDGINDYFSGFDLPGLDPETVFTDDQLKKSAFVCVTGDFYGWVGKLGYIFKLADGSFFIIDGGYTNPTTVIKDPSNTTSQAAAKYIMDVLEKYADDPNDIRLSWMVTHWHEDHVGALIEFSRNDAYLSRVTMDTFLYNMSSVECAKVLDGGLTYYYDAINKIINEFKPEKVVKAHPGQTLYFANLEYTVYTSQELLLYSPLSTVKNIIGKGNDTSITSKITFMGKNMLFTGDSSFEMNPYALGPCYWNAFDDIDILQVPHHGYADTQAGTFTKYLNNVSIVLWPVDARHFYGKRIGYTDQNSPNGYGGVVDVSYYSKYMVAGVKHYVHCVYDDIYFEFDGAESTWWTPEPVSDSLQIYDPLTWTDKWTDKSSPSTYWNNEYNPVYMKDKT